MSGSEGRGKVSTQPARSFYPTSPNQVSVTNTAQADPGQTFLGWSGDTNGASFLPPSKLFVVMNTNRVITARFTNRPARGHRALPG